MYVACGRDEEGKTIEKASSFPSACFGHTAPGISCILPIQDRRHSELAMIKSSPEGLRRAADRLRQESEREKHFREDQNRLVRGNVDKWAHWREGTKGTEAPDKE
jgi:hypothetical protein